jgi:hypothetical protein
MTEFLTVLASSVWWYLLGLAGGIVAVRWAFKGKGFWRWFWGIGGGLLAARSAYGLAHWFLIDWKEVAVVLFWIVLALVLGFLAVGGIAACMLSSRISREEEADGAVLDGEEE